MDTIPQDTPKKQCAGICQRVLPATTEFFHKNRNSLYSLCKDCRNRSLKTYNDAHVEHRKKRYQEHREEIRVKQKEYLETNREKVNEQKRQNYQEHREEIRAKQTQHRAAHRKEFNDRRRQYYWEDRAGMRTKQLQNYQEHREEKLIWAANYRNTHREEMHKRQRQARQERRPLYLAQRRAHKQRRRARLRSIEGTLTAQQIQDKLKSQRYRCYYAACGHAKFEKRKDRTYIYHLDHTVPISRNDFTPRNDADYVVLACPHCNQHKSDKLPHEWPEGGRLF